MSNIRLADCVKINANYSTIYTAIIDGHSDTCKTASINFADTFHDMQMSRSAVKSIKKAVNVILYLSRQFHYKQAYQNAAHNNLKNKSAKTAAAGCTTKRQQELQYEAAKSVKDTHLCTFLTLTLPSKQTHTDIELSKYAINPFLTYARKIWNVRHYIWKKELQKNGNIHYHLVTDRYIDADCLRAAWNRILNRGLVPGCDKPFDYVDRYSARMKELYKDGFDDATVLKYLDRSPYVAQATKDEAKAFEKVHGRVCTPAEYDQIFTRNKFAELEKYRRAYNAEMAKDDPSKRWISPNSTDISAIKTPKSVSSYVAKYIAKDIDDDPELAGYLEEVTHYKDMIFQCLRDMAKKKDNEEPITADDTFNLEHWKACLKETRKFCPIQGKLWYKSATLTPFLAGASDFISTDVYNELQGLMIYLRNIQKDKNKPLIVQSLGTKEDGTPDPNNVICTTLLINIFQLQMLKHKRRYVFPNLVRMWQRFIFDCKQSNVKRGLYRRKSVDIDAIAA